MQKALFEAVTLPSERNLRRLADQIGWLPWVASSARVRSIRLEVWRIRYDTRTQTLFREMLSGAEFPRRAAT